MHITRSLVSIRCTLGDDSQLLPRQISAEYRLFLSFNAEFLLQAGAQLHARLDWTSKPPVQSASHRVPGPGGRVGPGEAAEEAEAGDRGLEPGLLD